jgi:hypothetical protein
MSYELRHEGKNTLLFPPKLEPTKLEALSETEPLHVTISDAREGVPSGIECDIAGGTISLHWEGTTAEVAMKRETYFAEVPSQMGVQAQRALQVDPLLGLEAFQNSLLRLQEKGCLRSEENKRLRRRVVESVPLPPEVGYFLEFGSYDVNGYFDLTSDFRLEVISPIYAEGAAQNPEHLKGYETAYYNFEGTQESDRIRLSFASAKEVVLGEAPVEKHRAQSSVVLPDFPGYYRLLFMKEEMPANYVRRAILLAASEERALRKTSPRGQGEAEAFCREINAPDVTCVAFPANFGVNPQLRVQVNGKDKFVSVGGMLFEVLGRDVKGKPPKSLKVRRLYRGRLIPIRFTTGDVWRLVLMPGDEITY